MLSSLSIIFALIGVHECKEGIRNRVCDTRIIKQIAWRADIRSVFKCGTYVIRNLSGEILFWNNENRKMEFHSVTFEDISFQPI